MLLTAECHSRRSESDLELVRQSVSRSLVSKLWLRTLAEPMDSFPTVLHRMLPSLSFLVFFHRFRRVGLQVDFFWSCDRYERPLCTLRFYRAD